MRACLSRRFRRSIFQYGGSMPCRSPLSPSFCGSSSHEGRPLPPARRARRALVCITFQRRRRAMCTPKPPTGRLICLKTGAPEPLLRRTRVRFAISTRFVGRSIFTPGPRWTFADLTHSPTQFDIRPLVASLTVTTALPPGSTSLPPTFRQGWISTR